MAMTASDALLGVHVAAGAVALALGPLALVVRGWRRALAVGYQVAVAILTTTALGLVATDPARLWWLVPFAVGTEAAVIVGWWLARGRPGRVTPWRVRLMGGSYVSLITALLVVSWGSNVLAWVLPTILGVVIVETVAARAGRTKEGLDVC